MTNLNKSISIRRMVQHDLCIVMQWAQEPGCNPGSYETEALFAANPKGYYLLEIDNKPVASLAAVKYSPYLAFIGLYIVVSKFRGQGYGKLLWDAAMANIQNCTSIGLNSVMDQIKTYQKSGFYPAFLNSRWRGKPAKKSIIKGITLETEVPIKDLIDYDIQIFSTPRENFIAKWLTMPKSRVLSALDNKGNLCGYGVLSQATDGYKIAPLFSNNQTIAENIYTGLCQYVENNSLIQIDTSESNPYSSTFAKKLGLKKMFDTMRMYRGAVPNINHEKSFGLTTLEIG